MKTIIQMICETLVNLLARFMVTHTIAVLMPCLCTVYANMAGMGRERFDLIRFDYYSYQACGLHPSGVTRVCDYDRLTIIFVHGFKRYKN